MRIAQVAPLYESVPPAFYGGTERVVAFLTEELVRRGHEVTLFASGDSSTSARLIPGAPEALRLSTRSVDKLAPQIAMLARVEELAHEFDVIHNHVDYLAFPFMRHWVTPTITTLHGRLDIPELPLVYRRYPEVNLVSISNSQRYPLQPFGLRWMATVYHGIDCRSYSFSPHGGDYLVFLGRSCEDKRPDIAIEVAKRLGIPLKIAAKVDAADERWHREHVEPLLDHPLVEFLGEVNDRAKEELLGGAAALLFPSMWPEPFGMVMIEAMACGTPVIALRYGSVREVVSDGETGFICDSPDEMVAAVRRLERIDRQDCRRRVEQYFSAEVMADGYERVYQQLATQSSLRRVTTPGTAWHHLAT